jgi:3-oxoacyl-[acyl-carrier-protein] synthase III
MQLTFSLNGNQMTNVELTALGKYLPSRVMTNDELSTIVDTSDEWIWKRTGIRERRIASNKESTSNLAAAAARDALFNRGIDALEVDMIIVATMTPDSQFPAVACKVQDEIGADNASAFDISAACSGFVFALEIASQFLKTGTIQNALVIGAEILSRSIDWKDRSTCVLFGDGAGAALLECSKEKRLLESVLTADGSGQDLLYMPSDRTTPSAEVDGVEDEDRFLKMNGSELFQVVVPMICDTILETCEKANISLSEIELIVPHQANVHIIKEVSEYLEVPFDNFMINLDKYGNTSAASIPLALIDAIEEKKISPNNYVMLVGFGAGLTCGASLIKWSEGFFK